MPGHRPSQSYHGRYLVVVLLLGFSLMPVRSRDLEPQAEVVFQLPLAPSGMTMASNGAFLISVSYEEKPQNRVISLSKSGESTPFPNTRVSQAAPDEPLTLDAVRGMALDKNGVVWMLDCGRRTEVPPKIIAWDAEHKRLQRVLNLSQPALLPGSNLNDIAVDVEHQILVVADSASGVDAALVIIDLATGLGRRVLQGHPSVVPVNGLDLLIDGKKIQTRRLDGTLADPDGGVRPVALDRRGEWLYFGPMRSLKLYRVKTEHLRNTALSSDKLAGLVEEYSAKPLCSSISLDSKNNIYVSDLPGKAIGLIAASTRQYRVLAADPRFLWPDGLCFGPDGKLYFFTNPRSALPKGTRLPPESAVNYLFKLQTPASGRVGD
ncbi:MAG: hypothetical protein K8R87_08310 [Verrucomicrobia bacterium]|nr:hypothetical protein [Verrucomicrobiota bacterium]